MNVEIGQVWEDADSRRAGRTFEVVNIDDGMATCENLTGTGGSQPTKPTAFIKLERFHPKYYKLRPSKNKTIGLVTVGSVVSLKESEPPTQPEEFVDEFLPVKFDKIEIVRRKPKAVLVQECKNFWPGDWKEVGPCVMLCSEHNDFEVSIRELEEFYKPFEIRVKLYQFTIFTGTIRGDITDALTKVQDFFLVLNHELKNFIVGEEK